MAFMHCNFYSFALGKDVGMDVVLPDGKALGDLKVLTLLHGYGENETKWIRASQIENMAQESSVAVFMPDGENGFYTDMEEGNQYWEFFSKELPIVKRNLFPGLSLRREDNMIAGNEMGGYGALKLAVKCPEQFGCVGSFSGDLDLKISFAKSGLDRICEAVFGKKQIRDEEDLFWLLSHKWKDSLKHTKVYVGYGYRDLSKDLNDRFSEFLSGKAGELKVSILNKNNRWELWNSLVSEFLAYHRAVQHK